MKAAGALILLLCCLSEARAQAQGGPPGPNTPELWDEVKQLRDMVHGMGNTVIVQGEKLKTMEAKLTASEAEAQELRDTVVEQGNTVMVQTEKMKTMEAKLTASEAEVQELRDTVLEQGNTLIVQGKKLETMEASVTASKGHVQVLRDIVVQEREKLKNVEEEANKQRELVSDLQMDLVITNQEMEGIAKQNAG